MPFINDPKKQEMLNPAKQTESKARELPLTYWMNLVKGMTRTDAEATLKTKSCPPKTREEVLDALTKTSQVAPQQQAAKVPAAPAKEEKPVAVEEAPKPVEELKKKIETP